jgi:hypothetical protein
MSRSWSIGQDLTIPQLSLASFDPEVTCTPERQSIPILKSGWLYKQSDVLKRWNRYYFVIQGKMVSYYASDKPYDVPRRRGYVYHVNGTRDGRGLLIKLDHDFVLHVRSSDLNDLEEWRECLLLCKPKLPLSVNQMPIPNPSPRTL